MDTLNEAKDTPNEAKLLYCEICDHNSSDNFSYRRHLLTAKHKRSTNGIQKSTPNEAKQNGAKFSCEICNYYTGDKYNLNRHLLTATHLASSKGGESCINENMNLCKPISCENIHQCNICLKIFKYRTGIYKHKKKCLPIISSINNIHTPTLESIKNTTEFQEFMIEHTKELQHILLEQNKTIIELSSKVNINQHNSNNTNTVNNSNKFNLNFFLNETCKDAMNITEFMNSLQYKLSDLENTCDLGYVEGISRIIIRGLKDMDICKRPIHCSDLKRETIYLKVTNGWEKENENKEKLRKMIGNIANNNINQTCKWVEIHPNCKEWNNKNNTRYIKIVSASMGGADKEEDEKFINKIIHNVSKEVVLKKPDAPPL